MYEGKVRIELSRQEALVLFDWIATFDDSAIATTCDGAQQKVIWSVEGQLETILPEIFAPDYDDIITQAKLAVSPKG